MDISNAKILVMGLGSIGKRHIGNMEAMGIPCEHISILRTRKGTPAFGDEFLTAHSKHTIFTDEKSAFTSKPDIVFVTNPTAFHVPSALSALRAGAHVFIEKPLSHNTEGISALIKKIKEKKKVAYVAFNYRFHPLLKKTKELLDRNELGGIVSVYAENAERITDWHPWEDYKITYGARHDLGGGALATQSHEFDFLYWLFGKPLWVCAAGGHVTDLEMEVEDSVTTLIQFAKGVVGTIHLDYIQRPPKHFFEIVGTKGRLRCDFMSKELEILPLEGERQVMGAPEQFDRNDMYKEELAHFFDCIFNNEVPLTDVLQGEAVVHMIAGARASLEKKSVVRLD